MLMIRFLFAIGLAALLCHLPLRKPWLWWLKPVGHSPWEVQKYLVMPLFLQTFFECLDSPGPIYLPARLMMMVSGLIVMMILLYGCLAFFHLPGHIIYPLSYLSGLVAAFFAETIYLSKNITLHPYDPYFAALGILFILLIFILNTYYPIDHWFFKNPEHP